MAFWDRIKQGLDKTRQSFSKSLDPVLDAIERLDPTIPELPDEAYADLEEALLGADVGVAAAEKMVARVRAARPRTRGELEEALIAAVSEAVGRAGTRPLAPPAGTRPWVVLVLGVNGSGKTTLIGKLAERERRAGRSVLVVAADTFRAAAVEQLAVWAERSGAEIVHQRPGADPAAVAHDGLSAALARAHDVVLIDTAGRLHTHANLMDELAKLKRVIARQLAGAPHETLLVLDGTLGQNSFAQARRFHEALEVTGVAVNKLDGTARGGVVIAVVEELALPVRLVGIGEGIEDVEEFDARAFAEGLVRS